jgi:hypothetical protein
MSQNEDKIKVGCHARDIYTGFEGIVIARTEWLYACDRVTIKPLKLDKDGKIQDTECFDVQQVEVLADKAPMISKDAVTAKTGGPADGPKREADPTR